MNACALVRPGFSDRLERELKKLVPDGMEVNVDAPDDRKNSVWMGGAILAELPKFQKMWVSKETYDDCGPSIIHRNCF